VIIDLKLKHTNNDLEINEWPNLGISLADSGKD
jgi:hypothetical protein